MTEKERIARLESELRILSAQIANLNMQLEKLTPPVSLTENFLRYRQYIDIADKRGDFTPLFAYLKAGGTIPQRGTKSDGEIDENNHC